MMMYDRSQTKAIINQLKIKKYMFKKIQPQLTKKISDYLEMEKVGKNV